MNITAAKISGKEIDAKYPILNTKWKYSHYKGDWNGYNGYYYSNYKDWSTEIVTDPWYRELISRNPVGISDSNNSIFYTTVEGNKIMLIIYLKPYV
jgi:hypothetical protein